VGHPNGAPQIPPLRFHGKPGQVAPVGMTNRRGLLKRGRQLLGRDASSIDKSRCRNVRIKRTKRTKSGKERGPARSGYSAKAAGPLEPLLPGPSRLASPSYGVAFPKLSKLLNQENALGAPCLRGELCSPQAAPSRGAPMMRTSVIRHFDVTLPFASPKSLGWQALFFFGGWRRCTGKAHRCKAKQSRRGKTAPAFECYSHISTVFGRHQEG
jgi:hypothetical protein